MPRLRIVRIRPDERPRFQERVAALEALASYPIGADRFRIDHGPDYFAFFDRMGEARTYAALEGERVVAVATALLRRVPFRRGARPRRAWYLCDLKVHPDSRGQRIPLRMMRAAFLGNYLRCPRGYAISMNPGDGSPNRVVRLASHWRWSPIRLAGVLEIHSCDLETIRSLTPILREHRGAPAFLSLGGIKDIVLESTGRPMPLLHLDYGQDPAATAEPRPEHVHMLCALVGSPLAQALAAAGLSTDATASIIQHRMASDWSFVLTSEI